jgi:hypothetical protein
MGLPEDKVVRVLSFFIIFFTVVVIGVVWLRPDDGQTFSVFTGLVSGFSAALLMRFQSDKAIPTATPTVPKESPAGLR